MDSSLRVKREANPAKPKSNQDRKKNKAGKKKSNAEKKKSNGGKRKSNGGKKKSNAGKKNKNEKKNKKGSNGKKSKKGGKKTGSSRSGVARQGGAQKFPDCSIISLTEVMTKGSKCTDGKDQTLYVQKYNISDSFVNILNVSSLFLVLCEERFHI